MAAPTAPTLSTLVSEALSKAGYGTPPTAITTRGEDYWAEEIKSDIWNLSQGKLKSLETEFIHSITHVTPRISNQSDFSKGISMTLLDGTHYGTAQTGGTTSITLAAAEDATDVAGKEIFIYAGTGINQISFCTAYDTSTKIATILTVATALDNTSKYLILDASYPLDWMPRWHYDSIVSAGTKGTPLSFASESDVDYDEFILYPSPYRASAIPWGLRQRYYANLLTLDLAGDLMEIIYQEWRGLFVQGVFFKALQDMDDDRAEAEKGVYLNMLNAVIAREGIDV